MAPAVCSVATQLWEGIGKYQFEIAVLIVLTISFMEMFGQGYKTIYKTKLFNISITNSIDRFLWCTQIIVSFVQSFNCFNCRSHFDQMLV